MWGSCIGFPGLLALAMREVPASHAAVFTALLPLTTAAMAAWLLHQRAHIGFWVCAAAGATLVMVCAGLRAGGLQTGLNLEWADLALIGCVLAGAAGYIFGLKATPELGAERVICWVCVLALPITLPGTLMTWRVHVVPGISWLALIYLGVFSMWAGFFAWYRGLALGGVLRVSQVQLLQPFISILAAAPLLGEPLDWTTLGFALAVVATVFLGKRMV
jgi:drug/metabolite transporter (DMT)-like permease